tara:strand:+ start:834 stop:947 length:114 start_codon:yes stop_codon:yes gene_type:complete
MIDMKEARRIDGYIGFILLGVNDLKIRVLSYYNDGVS